MAFDPHRIKRGAGQATEVISCLTDRRHCSRFCRIVRVGPLAGLESAADCQLLISPLSFVSFLFCPCRPPPSRSRTAASYRCAHAITNSVRKRAATAVHSVPWVLQSRVRAPFGSRHARGRAALECHIFTSFAPAAYG